MCEVSVAVEDQSRQQKEAWPGLSLPLSLAFEGIRQAGQGAQGVAWKKWAARGPNWGLVWACCRIPVGRQRRASLPWTSESAYATTWMACRRGQAYYLDPHLLSILIHNGLLYRVGTWMCPISHYHQYFFPLLLRLLIFIVYGTRRGSWCGCGSCQGDSLCGHFAAIIEYLLVHMILMRAPGLCGRYISYRSTAPWTAYYLLT